MGIIKIDHLAIGVSDLEASERNWCDNFGATVHKRSESEALGIKQCYLAFPEGTMLELFQPIDDSSPMAAVLAESGEGYRAMTMMVDDVEETMNDLQAKGVRTFTQGDIVFLHPKSTNGLIISLMAKE